MGFVIGKRGRVTYPQAKRTQPGTVIQGRFVQPIDPGELQNITTTGFVPLLNGDGAPMETILPKDVRPDSVFRLSFGIGPMFATAVGSIAEVVFRGILFNNDDPLPPNYNPLGTDLGHIVGSVTNVRSSFGYHAYVSQAQIAAVKGDDVPTFGKVGFRLLVALANGEGADSVRIILQSNFSQEVYLGIEEIAGGALIIE